jgi:hypothetical protein
MGNKMENNRKIVLVHEPLIKNLIDESITDDIIQEWQLSIEKPLKKLLVDLESKGYKNVQYYQGFLADFPTTENCIFLLESNDHLEASLQKIFDRDNGEIIKRTVFLNISREKNIFDIVEKYQPMAAVESNSFSNWFNNWEYPEKPTKFGQGYGLYGSCKIGELLDTESNTRNHFKSPNYCLLWDSKTPNLLDFLLNYINSSLDSSKL